MNDPENILASEPVGIARSFRWTELIAALGVTLSLIFVGVQIRQNTKAIQAGTYQDLASQSSAINMTIAANPKLAFDFARYRGLAWDSSEATMRPLVLANVRIVENAFHMARLNAYDPKLLMRFEANPLYASENFKVWWAESRGRFAPDFQLYMDSLIKRQTGLR